MTMTNPNNCESCDHKPHQDGGWCYMFREEPQEVCIKHSSRTTQRAPWPLMRLCGLSADNRVFRRALGGDCAGYDESCPNPGQAASKPDTSERL